MQRLTIPSTDILIRPALKEEAGAIAGLLAKAFVPYRSEYTEEAYQATILDASGVEQRMLEGPVWVAEAGSILVGTVSLVHRGDSLYIRGMAVSPEYGGNQIGKLLLDNVEVYAREHNFGKLILSTTPFLFPAIHRYERCGFVRSEDGPRDLHGTPLFTMEKMLKTHE